LGNTKPVQGGLVYGQYLMSHNIAPAILPNEGDTQVYPTVLRIVKGKQRKLKKEIAEKKKHAYDTAAIRPQQQTSQRRPQSASAATSTGRSQSTGHIDV
jgi:hypothetical protein